MLDSIFARPNASPGGVPSRNTGRCRTATKRTGRVSGSAIPWGEGLSLFLLIYAHRKLQPSPGNQKRLHLTAGSFYASGTLPRSKSAPLGHFFWPGYTVGLRTCGYRIGLRPLGGACPLRPLRLLRLSVSAAGGGHLRSKLFSSPMVHGNSSSLKNIQ